MISRSSCIWLIPLHTGRSTPCRRILKSIRIRTKSVGKLYAMPVTSVRSNWEYFREWTIFCPNVSLKTDGRQCSCGMGCPCDGCARCNDRSYGSGNRQVIDALEKTGQLDNTLILFLSDNGCSNENCQNYSPGENDRPDMTRKGEKMVYPHNKEVLPGPQTTYASLGARWRMWQTHLSAFGKPNPRRRNLHTDDCALAERN